PLPHRDVWSWKAEDNDRMRPRHEGPQRGSETHFLPEVQCSAAARRDHLPHPAADQKIQKLNRRSASKRCLTKADGLSVIIGLINRIRFCDRDKSSDHFALVPKRKLFDLLSKKRKDCLFRKTIAFLPVRH